VPDTSEFNTIAQTSVIILALILRLTIGTRFLQKRWRASTYVRQGRVMFYESGIRWKK
jgi:hypothetical protein